MLPQLLVKSKRQRKSCLPLFRILAGTDSGAPTCLRVVWPCCLLAKIQARRQVFRVSKFQSKRLPNQPACVRSVKVEV